MRKFVLSIVAVLAVFGSASAQKSVPGMRVPVEEDILPKILSPESTFYYPGMMARYMAGDGDLTADHYYYLYYGFAYENAYDSHKELPGENVIYEIFARTEHPTPAEALSIIEAGRENMLVDPFSPGNINMMTYAYQIVGDTINAALSAARFRGIIGAVEASGTGLRENTPWHVLRFSHASDLVAARGLKIANRQVRSRDVEYIQVGKNADGVKGYFFNFERVYRKPYEGERVNKKSNWMLNGFPI